MPPPVPAPAPAAKTRLRLTILQKLVGLTAVLIIAIVGALTVYFTRQQADTLSARLRLKVEKYSQLLSKQVASAVAFDDRETAREVLSSLDTDQELAALELFGQKGVSLYRQGEPGSWTSRVSQGVTGGARVFAYQDRVIAVSPVVSLEGPRGVLVIELTTKHVRELQARVMKAAAGVGVAALLFGVLAAWFIARSLSRRLRAMAQVATAVTDGDLDRDPVNDATSDEIGTLARAFNAMLGRLKTERDRLEQNVQARTTELVSANDQLKAEMDQRSRMELELRQAQKLESVGRLAAGVAHEINTPVQFVNDSVHFVRDAMKDLAGLIAAYREICRELGEGLPATEAGGRIEEAERAADVEFVIENVPTALERSIDGLTRIANIVRSMKDFAHPEQKDMAPVDLNRAVEATLTIATNEYKYVADVDTELGELPMVSCYGGEINQVILNIVVNAAHAIGDVFAKTDKRGRISVKTRRDGDDAVISITDTGGGIPESARDRIFDPFFTTKEVGKGTGQGLAIARRVVHEKHGGELTFTTEMGVGTTFFVRIPIEGKPQGAADEPSPLSSSSATPLVQPKPTSLLA